MQQNREEGGAKFVIHVRKVTKMSPKSKQAVTYSVYHNN